MERRYLKQHAATVRIDGDDSPTITGYASVTYDGTPATQYDLWPGVVERIMPGAFDGAIARGDDARGLFNHDSNMLLGRRSADTLKLATDSTGLRYDIDPPDTQVGRDVVEMIKRGDLQGSSFAFIVTDEEWRKEDGLEIREIQGVELFDVGPVTYPAYENTTTGVRSQTEKSDARTAYAAWKSSIATKRANQMIQNRRIDAAQYM